MSIRRYNAANKKNETSPKFSETSDVLLRASKKKSKSSYILDPFHPVYHQPNTNKLSQSLMSISILSLFQHQQESCMLHTSLLYSWSNNPCFIHSLSTLPPPSLLECYLLLQRTVNPRLCQSLHSPYLPGKVDHFGLLPHLNSTHQGF